MSDFSLGSLWDTAATVGADQSFAQPRTADTVPTNAIGSLQPVAETGGAWGAFWQNTIGSVVSYGLARDAARNGISQAGAAAPGYTPTVPVSSGPATTQSMVLVAAAIGVGVLVVGLVLRGR